MILNTLENDKNIDVVYLDYKKAFDKADHSIILRGLREKGIGGKIGKWIQNYLEDRSQSVMANNRISNDVKVISGVPQGSVIGPILFLVIIDNISYISIKSSLGIFADDSRISREINSYNDAENLQDDLLLIYDWAIDNNMDFNRLKFQALKYGRNSEMKDEYEYVNSEFLQFIENVNSTRDLGIIMSTDGHFDEHIDKVVTKSRQRCGWIN